MKLTRRLRCAAAAVTLHAMLLATPAAAAPSCIQQVGSFEREVLYGTEWGRVIGSLASDPVGSGLTEFGFDKIGDLVVFVARAPKEDCPFLP